MTVGHFVASVSAAAAGEEQDLVSCRPAVVKVEAGLCERAHDKHGIVDIDMGAIRDDVPSLAISRTTGCHLDWCQIRSKVARQLVYREAFPIRCLWIWLAR